MPKTRQANRPDHNRQRKVECLACGTKYRASRACLDQGLPYCGKCGERTVDVDRNPHAGDAFLSDGATIVENPENARLRARVRHLEETVRAYTTEIEERDRALADHEAWARRDARESASNRSGWKGGQPRCDKCSSFLPSPTAHCDCGWHQGMGTYLEGSAGHRQAEIERAAMAHL